ncbi:MAG: hypothetical protein WD801_16530 [Gemmatimonadaceae bacterium]
MILSKAAELAGSSRSVGRIEDGLTLEEITSIAAEAGLDPDSIARAARLIPDVGQRSVLRRVMGGALRVRQDFGLPGELTNERAQRIVNSARTTMRTHGVGDAGSSGVSWSTGAAGNVFVSAHGEAAGTRVQVTVDHRNLLILPVMLGTFGVLATLYTGIAAGDSGFVNPYLVLAGGTGITAALVWSVVRRIAGKARATLESLIDAIGESHDGNV